MDVVAASLRLADLIRGMCPGPHRYVQHRDTLPPWCPACGYGQTGARIQEVRS